MSRPILPIHAQKRLQRKFGSNDEEANVKVYYSTPCTCTQNFQSTPDPKCPICFSGIIYKETPEEILVTRTGMKIERTPNEALYNLYKGGARITIYPEDKEGNEIEAYTRIAIYDVIVSKDTRRASEICHYGRRDRLYAFNVLDVIQITSQDDYENVEFIRGEDYEIETGELVTEIKWTEGGKKPKEFYSVEYISYVNFMVWEDAPKWRGPADGKDPRVIWCVLRAYDGKQVPAYMEINTEPESNANVE